MEEGVLEKGGKELFRELLRLFPTAEHQDYFVNGVWRDDVMRLDLRILVGHRQEAGAPPPIALEEVELPELPPERPKKEASTASSSGPSKTASYIATLALRKMAGTSGKGVKAGRPSAVPKAGAADSAASEEPRVPQKPGLRIWQGGMSSAAKAKAAAALAKAKVAAAKAKLSAALSGKSFGTPAKAGQVPLRPGQINQAKASDGSAPRVVKAPTPKAGSAATDWSNWTGASSGASQSSTAGEAKLVPARPGFAAIAAKAKAKAAAKAFKLWGAGRTVSSSRSQSWGSSQEGSAGEQSWGSSSGELPRPAKGSKARGKGKKGAEPSAAAQAAALGVSRPKAAASKPRSGAAAAIVDMRQIASFVTKFRMDPTKGKLLLAPLTPSRRRFVIQNFTSPVNGANAVGKLHEYINQCEKQNLWAGANAGGSASAGVGLRPGVKRPMSISGPTLQNLAIKRARMVAPRMTSPGSAAATAVGAKTSAPVSPAGMRSFAVSRSRAMAAAGKAAAAIRAKRLTVSKAVPTPPAHAPPGMSHLKRTVPPRPGMLGTSGAKRPATSWSGAPPAKVPKVSAPAGKGVVHGAKASSGAKGVVGKGTASSGKGTASSGKGSTFPSIVSNAGKGSASNSGSGAQLVKAAKGSVTNSGSSSQGSWTAQSSSKGAGTNSRSASASSGKSWSGGSDASSGKSWSGGDASKNSWDKGASSKNSWDKGASSSGSWGSNDSNSGNNISWVKTPSKQADNSGSSWSSWSSSSSQQGQDKSSWKSDSSGGSQWKSNSSDSQQWKSNASDSQQWKSNASDSQQWKSNSSDSQNWKNADSQQWRAGSSESWRSDSQSGGKQSWNQPGRDYGSAKGSGKSGKDHSSGGKGSKGSGKSGKWQKA